MNFYLKIAVILVLLISWNNFAYANKDSNNKGNKDTADAFVINPNDSQYQCITNLPSQQIINIIDSLLNLDVVPIDLIKKININAEGKLYKNVPFVSLTNYYDNSEIPSNSMYGSWDTDKIFPYNDSITQNDSLLFLTLTDKVNFCDFVAPLQSPVITSNFGWRDGRAHCGIDLDLEVWDTVVASFDGMVRSSFYHPGYGRVVIIRHYNGLETLYAHLHRFKVKVGDIVEAGQLIGLGGSSGKSSGSHLHYEVRFKGKTINPRHIISFKENKLISDSLMVTKKKRGYSVLPMGIDFHTIKRGDYMYKIANRYGISVNELCEMNGMRRNSLLRVGKKLRIN